jgi:hypothetical protein
MVESRMCMRGNRAQSGGSGHRSRRGAWMKASIPAPRSSFKPATTAKRDERHRSRPDSTAGREGAFGFAECPVSLGGKAAARPPVGGA